MALADWLLPLLLLAADEESGHFPFDWTSLDREVAPPPVPDRRSV